MCEGECDEDEADVLLKGKGKVVKWCTVECVSKTGSGVMWSEWRR